MGILRRILCLLFLSSTICCTQAFAKDELTQTTLTNRYQILLENNRFSGSGVNFLQNKASQAQFFLLGEEHGIAENPLLAAQLFESLVPHGYLHFGIEVSPAVASYMEQALLSGGMRQLELSFDWGVEPAFFGMYEEALMLSRIRNSIKSPDVFWGLDYEVASDLLLIRLLNDTPKPESAEVAMQELTMESQRAWQKYFATKGPQHIFTFSGSPEWVKKVQRAWPSPNDDASTMLNTLYETLSINQLWVSGKAWESNERRANLFKTNFTNYWQNRTDTSAKVMFKLGASHLMRGLNSNDVYDLGNLLPEIAAASNQTSFSVLVLPGKDSQVAVLDPTNWVYKAAPAKDGYSKNLEFFYDHSLNKGFTAFDLAPLRNVIFKSAYKKEVALRQLVMRFDALLIMTDSTPARQLIER